MGAGPCMFTALPLILASLLDVGLCGGRPSESTYPCSHAPDASLQGGGATAPSAQLHTFNVPLAWCDNNSLCVGLHQQHSGHLHAHKRRCALSLPNLWCPCPCHKARSLPPTLVRATKLDLCPKHLSVPQSSISAPNTCLCLKARSLPQTLVCASLSQPRACKAIVWSQPEKQLPHAQCRTCPCR